MPAPQRSRRRLLRRAITAAIGLLAVVLPAEAAAATPAPAGVPVQLLSITDLHGYFGEYTTTVPGPHAGEPARTVGGGAYLATHLDRLRAPQNSILFSAGDDFSGWPDETEWFWNEPTIEYLNMLGVQFSTVGNHELDRVPAFLRHMTEGSCEGRPDRDLCFVDSTGERFHGADFDYYSGNVVDGAGRLLAAPYHVQQVDDGKGGRIPVGFVHATSSLTANEQLSYYPTDELRFLPEADTVNRYAEELRGQGVQAIVAVIHEGFSQADGAGYEDCTDPFGPVAEFNREITPAVDVIVSGHWHALVNCMLPDPAGALRPVVEAGNHGRLINEIRLELDPATGDVLRDRTVSTNHPNTRDVPPDPEVLRMAQYWRDRLAERARQPVAQITADLIRTPPAGEEESTLGNLTADAFQWAALQGTRSDLAVVMPGVLRKDVTHAPAPGNSADAPGRVLFSELVFGVVYENGIGPALVTGTVTGRGLDALLESQWQQGADGQVTFRPMAVSGNVTYAFDAAAPVGERVAFGQVRIDGRPLHPNDEYRVTTLANNFFPRNATPGFTALFEARDQDRSIYSGADALWKYMEGRSPVVPPALGRTGPQA